MKKPLGCFSVYGLIAALLALAVVGVFSLLKGGPLFSPGPLTAARQGLGPLQGVDSHADLEDACTLCHRPWAGVDAGRCLACHTNVDAQIAGQVGLHGVLQEAGNCVLCHSEHQGREARITGAALLDFPHDRLGYALREHQRLPDELYPGDLRSHDELYPPDGVRPATADRLECADCHVAPGYAFEQATCTTCHREMDAGFITQHIAAYGDACLSCHDGSMDLAGFDHQAVFALQDAHAAPSCRACHEERSLDELSAGCAACHPDPIIHGGRFGDDCGACHTAEGWRPARLRYHAFPLDHGGAGEGTCLSCHPDDYVAYTCMDCHEHGPALTVRQHPESMLADIADCARCHPGGRKDEAG